MSGAASRRRLCKVRFGHYHIAVRVIHRPADPLLAWLVIGGFTATIVAMAFREVLDVKLGFIAMTGALLLIAVVELLGERLKNKPDFEEAASRSWTGARCSSTSRLFALVGTGSRSFEGGTCHRPGGAVPRWEWPAVFAVSTACCCWPV